LDRRKSTVHIRVITPAYNVAAFIGDAIASVLAQTHEDWSILVIDDGSGDGTADVAGQYRDARITVLRQANAGVSAARNRGLAEPGGDGVLFLDADDWLAPEALARLIAALGTGAACAGPYCYVTEDGTQVVHRKPVPFPPGDILERLLVQNLFANGGHLLIRRDAAERAGSFRADIAYGEDWEYWIRVALTGRFSVAPGAEPVLFVRQRAGGAYLRMASDPDAFTPCMEAIFSNPALIARLGADRLTRLRRRTEAENAWIVGRELIRHGKTAEGRRWLLRSFAASPSAKRSVLLGAAFAMPALPQRLHGPFRQYTSPAPRI
jgi:glycosyltransferase involved in cell wall biosynthesis